jgi:bacterioferritin-associated ferredoxin
MYEDLVLELIPEDDYPQGEFVWWAALRERVQQALITVHNESYAMAVAATCEACAKVAASFMPERNKKLDPKRLATIFITRRGIAAAIRARSCSLETENEQRD